MLPGTGWCGAGLAPFPTTCWWLTHPAAITGASVSARRDSPGGCGGPSVLLLCNRRVQSLLMPIRFRCARRPQCPVRNLNIVVCSCLTRRLTGSVEGVVVSSGSFLLTFLSVSEQGFGFLVRGGGRGLQLLAPSLSQAICSFISWNPTVSRDPL